MNISVIINKRLTAYRYPYLVLRRMVLAELKLRYQNSILGYLWSFVKPLAMFAILYVVFVYVFNVGGTIPHYAPYLLLGIVMWNFFAEVTTVCVGSLVAKGDLLRKISFPEYTIILSSAASALINLLINFIVVFVLIVLNGASLRITALLFPAVLLQLVLLGVSAGLILSTLYVRLRDTNFIWEVFLQAAFYATPIIYPLSMLAQKSVLLAKIIMLNPMAQVIQDMRYILVTNQTSTVSALYGTHWIRVIPYGLTLLLLAASINYFRNGTSYFAEEV